MSKDIPESLEDLKRTIVLLYGMMANGNPCWIFTAIRPSKYQQFQTAYKEQKIDLNNFSEYGELIISGNGKSPPDDVILKVAEMYQTTPEELAKAIDSTDDNKPQE